MRVILRWSSARQTPLVPVRYPFRPLPRLAVLEPGFQRGRHLGSFPDGDGPALRRHRPEALAGSIETLRRLARDILSGQMPPLPLQSASLVFTDASVGLLGENDRDLLWEAFQVPFFEQFYHSDGVLLAEECEARVGLHVLEEEWAAADGIAYVQSLLTVDVATEVCACGRREPRLLPVRPRLLPRVVPSLAVPLRALAASVR